MTMPRIVLFSILFCSQLFGFAQHAKVVGYLPFRAYNSASSIEFCKLTHLNISFANPDSNGNFPMLDYSEIIKTAKKQNPGISIFISMGGGGLQKQAIESWSQFVDYPQNRATFISKIMDYVEKNQFDGIDFDLEWDAITTGYSDFVVQMKDSLNEHGKELSAALPADFRSPNINDKALACFDFINIMAYDETGPWKPDRSGQHSSFEYAKKGIAFWKSQGIPAIKLTLGVPFYGYNFDDKNNVSSFSYSQMAETDIANTEIDKVGKAFYNGRPTIGKKVELAAAEVSGIMIWQIAQDKFDQYSLLTAIHNKFTALKIKTTGLCGNDF